MPCKWINGPSINIRVRLPRIRACLFDMDGLLIDSEDKYTMITNEVLAMYGKPSLPWSIKAQLQGRPQPEVRISPVMAIGDIFTDNRFRPARFSMIGLNCPSLPRKLPRSRLLCKPSTSRSLSRFLA